MYRHCRAWTPVLICCSGAVPQLQHSVHLRWLVACVLTTCILFWRTMVAAAHVFCYGQLATQLPAAGDNNSAAGDAASVKDNSAEQAEGTNKVIMTKSL